MCIRDRGAFQTVITKIGLVLLVLGAAHGGTMLALARIRSRRREQVLELSLIHI